MKIILPEGCELRNYAGDLLLVGPGLNRDRFQEIKATLPGEIQARLIGWKRTLNHDDYKPRHRVRYKPKSERAVLIQDETRKCKGEKA